MPTEENKALTRRVSEELYSSRGNPDAAGEIYAPDFVAHNPNSPEEIHGPEGVKQLASAFRSAFPDMQSTVEDQIAEGDKVVTRYTFSGTHQGELMGIPPHRKPGTDDRHLHEPHLRGEDRGRVVQL